MFNRPLRPIQQERCPANRKLGVRAVRMHDPDIGCVGSPRQIDAGVLDEGLTKDDVLENATLGGAPRNVWEVFRKCRNRVVREF